MAANGSILPEGIRQRHDTSQSLPSSYTVLDLEIDRNCTPSGLAQNLCSFQQQLEGSLDVQLLDYNDVPEFLKGNPYVKKGYRVLFSSSACFKSLFLWSNESVNIWTHLLGFLFFFAVMLYDNIIVLYGSKARFGDYLWISIGLLCYQFCMLCSAGFHLFGCHSERASHRWLSLDLAGISIGLIGCYLPAVHLAFYCHFIWRDFYLMTVSVLAGVTLFCQLHPRFLSQSWAGRRLLLYSALAGFGLIPTVHWVLLNGGLDGPLVQLFLPKIVVMYGLGLLAMVFYLSKAPERCFPGRVDYIGSSHQWWHVIVVLAFYWWHRAGEDILQYRMTNICPHY